jgi:Arc/MetJ-type ribon-helix-helix transcriptional regulator
VHSLGTTPAAGGRLYGMVKTTVYLPDPLKRALAAASETEGKSEAEIIREAVQEWVERTARRAPRLPLVDAELGDPTIARHVDDLLDDGFGR